MSRDLTALIAFVDARQDRPHEPGRDKNDCVGYCLAAAEVQTGIKVAADVTWKSHATGMRALKRFGCVEAAFDHYFERVAPAFAQHGDIAGVPNPDMGLHPMIVEGVTLVGPGEHGNTRVKRSAMTVAWSIERMKRP